MQTQDHADILDVRPVDEHLGSLCAVDHLNATDIDWVLQIFIARVGHEHEAGVAGADVPETNKRGVWTGTTRIWLFTRVRLKAGSMGISFFLGFSGCQWF